VQRQTILKAAGGAAVVLVFFFGTLRLLDLSSGGRPQMPAHSDNPPLPQASRSSVIVAPAAIGLPLIRQAMEQAAPRSLAGKPDNPISKLLSKAEIGYTLERSNLSLTGRADGLIVGTNLNGSLRITGEIATQLSGLGGAIGNLLNEQIGRSVKQGGSRVLDQRADIRGQVSVTARPTVTTGWRLEPNIQTQVSIAEANIQLAGLKLNGASEIKPVVDRAVAEQTSALQARLRGDPFIELAAKRDWGKLCRSVALGAMGAGLPDLWLEMRPTRAFAAQPRIDASNVTLTLGIEAQTRVVPQQTKPDCPFPGKLELVPPLDQGRIAIGLPIDIPFTEINRMLEEQLKGKTFPDDASLPVQATVQRAALSAAGERMLISLLVKLRESKSWFGFGTEATVHVAGRPVLDQAQQSMRFEDIAVTVESEAAFGLLGAAAKAALPYLQGALARHAVFDLKPVFANARRSIDKAIADFRQQNDDVRVDASITGLRLVGLEFDSRIVRVTAEADGFARAVVNRLPGN
jgi:hypothetical protein